MSTPPPDPATTVARRHPGRFKRLSFVAGLVLLLYIVTELLVFVTGAIFDHRLSWIAFTQVRRDELRVELEDRPGLLLQIHPYVGYVEAPPKAVGGDSNGRLRAMPTTSLPMDMPTQVRRSTPVPRTV